MTTRELSEASGATLRQIQWWDEQGFLKCSFLGRIRRWRKADVARARRLKMLSRAGIQPNRAEEYLALPFRDVVRLEKPVLLGSTLYIP